MAENLFSGLGFETPEQIRERISKRFQTQERARYENAAQNFARAGTHAGRMGALGQQLGMTLRGAFSGDQPDFSTDPEVVQAQERQDVITSINLNNPEEVANAGKVALDNKDVAFGTWLYDRANQLSQQQARLDIEQSKLDAKKSTKDWKWKHWQEGIRDNFAATTAELEWVKDINNEEQEADVASAVNARAEDLWNTYRERGADISQQQAYNLAARTAKNYFKGGFLNDTFDFDGYANDFSDSFNIGEVKYNDNSRPETKKRVDPGVTRTPPAAAVKQLIANPATASQFDEIFGKGAAARYLPKAQAVQEVVEEDDEDPYDIDF